MNSKGKFINALNQIAQIPDRIPLKHQRLFVISRIGCLFGIAAHILLLMLFLLLNVKLLFYFNILSIILWIIAFYVGHKYEYYFLSIAIAFFEMVLHQTLCVLYVGWDAGFQYYLFIIVIIPFLFRPIADNRIKKIITYLSASISIISFLALDVLFRKNIPLYSIDPIVLRIINAINIVGTMIVLGECSYSFHKSIIKAEDSAEKQFLRAEYLLHNILPVSIADRLKKTSQTIADGFDCVTVLFADIVDFTKIASKLSPESVVDILNKLFTMFDEMTERFGLEKIKTIGDAYMVAAGIPERNDHHALATADFALEMMKELSSFNAQNKIDLKLRVGINSGYVVAGVIGKKKFIYDLWGDAVNLASRMESHGIVGEIQVTENTYMLLRANYVLQKRGEIEIKGKGQIMTYLLKRKKL
jgi:class 3 adenylate cyclase